MFKRELFKQMLVRESYVPPVVDEFDVMVKRAAAPMTDQTRNIIMNSLPLVSAGLITLGAATGINKLMKVHDERKDKETERAGFQKVLELYPELKEKGIDQKRLKMAYDAYMQYAPSTAKHPIVVGQALAQYGPTNAVNTTVMKEMAQMENYLQQADDKRTSKLVKTEFSPIPAMTSMQMLMQNQGVTE